MKLIRPFQKKNKAANYLSGITAAFILFMVFASAPSKLAIPFASFLAIGYLFMLFFTKMPKGILGSCVAVCSCNSVPGNSGIGCNFLMAVGKNPWFVPMQTSAGVLNYIDLTAALDSAYFTGLFNNADQTARFYPFPEVKNVDNVRDKTVVEAAKDATEYFVRYGIRKFTGYFFPDSGASGYLTGIINNLRCNKTLGVYMVDANGTIWGQLSDDGTKLYPMKIDPQSISGNLIYTTDSTVEKVQCDFNFHPSMNDCSTAGIPQSSLVGDYNPLYASGLLNINLIPISADHTAGTIVFKLNDGWGNAVVPEAVTGLLKANFAVYDITGLSALTINTCTENANIPGQYSLLMTSSFSAADLLRVTPTKTGYDGTPASQVQIVAT